MKTFKDLEFSVNKISLNQARMQFDNGYGVSVISGRGAYGDEENPYELAVLYNGDISYNTHITDDVVGHCNEERISELMIEVQKLEENK